MSCECAKCGSCGGSGSVWYGIDGEFLGNHRGDDLDTLEPREDCGGSGVSEVCYECQEALEMEESF